MVAPLPSSSVCKIQLESLTAQGGKLIKVLCDEEMLVSLDLEDGGSYSTLKVVGDKLGQHSDFLQVEYYKESQDMYLTIEGVQFNVKDDKAAEETATLVKLLDNPDFSFFPTAVRLIHDELQLKGWESPAVMFLYRLGMAAEGYHMETNKREFMGFEKKASVDAATYDYHGPSPAKQCTYNGWSFPDMDALIADNCRGICGQVCHSCWNWVCGDCCAHTGCMRHDIFCNAGYYTSDCLTCRGVLWDTITDTPLDC